MRTPIYLVIFKKVVYILSTAKSGRLVQSIAIPYFSDLERCFILFILLQSQESESTEQALKP